MSDIVEFLKARLDDDEKAARECVALFPEPWDIADRGWRVRIYAGDVPTPNLMIDDEDAMTTRNPVVLEVEPDRHIEDPEWLSTRIEHIVRQGPTRTLREVEAKRSIMSEHELEDYEGVPSCWLCAHVYSWGKEPDRGPCATFRALAAVYADHPDYRDEWRP